MGAPGGGILRLNHPFLYRVFEVEAILLRVGEVDVERIKLGDGSEQAVVAAGGDKAPLGLGALARHAVDGGGHLGVAEVELRLFHLGLSGLMAGDGRFIVGDGVVIVLATHHLTLEEGNDAIPIGTGLV